MRDRYEVIDDVNYDDWDKDNGAYPDEYTESKPAVKFAHPETGAEYESILENGKRLLFNEETADWVRLFVVCVRWPDRAWPGVGLGWDGA